MRKKITLALLSLLLVPLAMMAQDVSMSLESGNLMAALTQDNEVGSERGWSSTWKHNQLSLTMTVSDFCNLTAGGDLLNPAGNLLAYPENATNQDIIFDGGGNADCYMSISLPKGMRFTGYEIVLANDLGTQNIAQMAIQAQQKVFYETDDLSYRAATKNMYYNDANDYANFDAITSDIAANNSHYLALAKNGDTYIMSGSTSDANLYTISREGDDLHPMTNHLYFRLSHAQNAYFGVRIVSAKFFFTAEGDFTETVSPKATPSSITTTGVNFMNAPFATSKLDLGLVEKDANGHYTYNYMNVRDLEANNVIYEDDAVTSGALPETPGAGGIFGTYNDGKYYYGLKNNTYYVECPTTAPTSEGEDNPIGLRIVGAKVHYTYGKQESADTYNTSEDYDGFYITATGTYTYTYWGDEYQGAWHDYLTNSGTVTYSDNGGIPSDAAVWFMDEEGYIRTGSDGGTYLTYTGTTGTTRTVSTTDNKNDAKPFNLVGSHVTFNYNNTTFYLQGQTYYDSRRGRLYHQNFRFNNNNPDRKATRLRSGTTVSVNTGTVTAPAFRPQPYILTVYKEDGTTVQETVYVGEAGTTVTVDGVVHERVESGTVELTNLNNDAIKFMIEDLPADAANTNYQALVTVELTMQALNPYLSQMAVVCSDPQTNIGTEDDPKPLRIEQSFTASDFKVSGGAFNFYLPAQCLNHTVQISFEKLRSNYADESYTIAKDGFNGKIANFSRINFVNSLHYQQFTSGGDNNIYNNYSEAADPQKDRVSVSGSGIKAFKFNNAADVSAGTADSFVEYPFSLAEYGAANFQNLTFVVSAAPQQATRYVFTTDETAYNISLVTTTQHRAYAFYTMVVNVSSKTYQPHVKFLPVYEKSETSVLYGNREQADFYGAEVTAPYNDGSGIKQGYAQTDQIFTIIDAAVNGNTATGTVKDENNVTIGTYEGWASGLTSATQLLYLDFSKLAGMFQVTTEQHGSMDDYSGTNAPNCIIFLPVNASAPNNNVAVKQESGSFRAANNIVLTDKQPFFIPYDIQVGGDNYASYTREVTTAHNGKVTSATLILPFKISVNAAGEHTNINTETGEMESKWAFSIHEMQSSNCLGGEEEEGAAAYAYFPAINAVQNLSKANYPYLVKVNTDNQPEGQNISFICSQKGAELTATPVNNQYIHVGAESTGTDPKDSKSLTFTPYGTYSGKLLPYLDYYYYFSSNMFVRSNEYKYKTPIRVTPFRVFYATNGSANPTPLSKFDIFFGEGEGNQTDGIGTMNSLHNVDMNAPVYDLQGRKLADSLIGATLKRGIYVIDGVKFVVK